MARALSILKEGSSQITAAVVAWTVKECQETNEAPFDVCWSCGGLREEVEGKSGTAVAETTHLLHFRDSFGEKSNETSEEPSKNPYDSTRPFVAQNDDELAEEEAAFARMKIAVQHAYYAAIIGRAFCPFLVHLISLVILLSARFQHVDDEPK